MVIVPNLPLLIGHRSSTLPILSGLIRPFTVSIPGRSSRAWYDPSTNYTSEFIIVSSQPVSYNQRCRTDETSAPLAAFNLTASTEQL